MTIQAATARVALLCNGATTLFPVNIQAYNASDFLILATNTTGATLAGIGAGASVVLTLNSDYTMAASGTLAPPFWALTSTVTYPTGINLLAILNPTETHLTQYPQGQTFPSLAVQTDFDRLTQMVIRLSDQMGRTIRQPDGDVTSWNALVSAAARANTLQGYDASGNPTIAPSLATVLTQAAFNALLTASPPYVQTPAELAAGVTPVNLAIPPTTPVDLRRYGQNGVALADTTALTSALAVVNGNGVIVLPANYAGTNPASLPAGVTIIDYRIGGTFPTGNDLLGGGRWINVGGNPEGSQAGFHTQQWVTSPTETTSAILGTNKVTGNLTAGGGAMAAGTFELDTTGTLTGIGGNIVQALTGQIAIRSLGQTLPLVTGVEGGGGIDRTTTTTNINTWVSVQGDGMVNASSAGATVTNAYGGRFIKSAAAGITNNNFALSCVGDAMFRIGDSLRIENGSALATIAFTFTSNTLVNMPAGVNLGLAASLGINGASPPAQPTGYGTPTGGAHQASFAAGAITLPNLAAAVAQLIIELKAYGIIAA